MSLDVRIQKRLNTFTLDVAFTAEQGPLALLGASGSGKSMTLKCIAGLERPDHGRIVLDGRVLFDSKQGINLPPQARRVGYLFQQGALFPNMTVAENLKIAMRCPASEKDERLQSLVRRFQIAGLEGSRPLALSCGQQQRAALARLIASEPELLLLDEPFSALDDYLAWQLEEELRAVLKTASGRAILVTHDRGEAYRLARRIAVIERGQLEIIADREILFSAPGTRASTLLTGCKNVSAAKKIGGHALHAADWNLDLVTNAPVPDDIRYVAIRAHYLRPVEVPPSASAENGSAFPPNTFDFLIRERIENVFSTILMVGSGHPLRYETDELPEGIAPGGSIRLTLPPERLMLLTK